MLQALISLGEEVGKIAASDLRGPNRLPPLREIATEHDITATLRR